MKRSYRVTDDGLKEIQVMNKKQFPCSPTTPPEDFTQQDIADLLHALDLPDIKNFEEWNTKRKEDTSTIPTFAMEDEHNTLMNCMDEIIMVHRCKKCYVFLCCASHVYHHPNCWFTDVKGQATWRMLQNIYHYRFDVFQNCMKGWEDYCYEPFNVNKHMKPTFAPQHVGLFVRCFTCARCTLFDHEQCHASYHNHTIHRL